MLFDNEICAGCGKPIAEGDDIVVCPDCGTPQHRACWQQSNCCVNAARHAEGYEWSACAAAPSAQDEPKQPEPEAATQQAAAPEDVGEVTCPYCGAVSPADALHCKECGTPFVISTPPPHGHNPYMFNADMNENDPIGDTTAGRAAAFVGSAARRYLHKFRALDEKGGKGISWNWAAFFFAPFWFFYRKLNKLGVLLTAVLLTLSLVSSPFYSAWMNDVAEIYAPYTEQIESGTLTDADVIAIGDKAVAVTQSHALPLGIMAAVNLIFHIACALIANKAYYRKMLGDIRLISEASSDEEMARYIALRRGGASLMNFIAGYCGYNLAITLISYLVN